MIQRLYCLFHGHKYGELHSSLHHFWKICHRCSKIEEFYTPHKWGPWKRYGITFQSRNCTVCNREEVV